MICIPDSCSLGFKEIVCGRRIYLISIFIHETTVQPKGISGHY